MSESSQDFDPKEWDTGIDRKPLEPDNLTDGLVDAVYVSSELPDNGVIIQEVFAGDVLNPDLQWLTITLADRDENPKESEDVD